LTSWLANSPTEQRRPTCRAVNQEIVLTASSVAGLSMTFTSDRHNFAGPRIDDDADRSAGDCRHAMPAVTVENHRRPHGLSGELVGRGCGTASQRDDCDKARYRCMRQSPTQATNRDIQSDPEARRVRLGEEIAQELVELVCVTLTPRPGIEGQKYAKPP
jgi:hypothetical protein